jgi:hypothetical protein
MLPYIKSIAPPPTSNAVKSLINSYRLPIFHFSNTSTVTHRLTRIIWLDLLHLEQKYLLTAERTDIYPKFAEIFSETESKDAFISV